MKEIVNQIIGSSDLIQGVESMVEVTTNIALGLTAFFLAIRFLWALGESIFSGVKLDSSKVFGTVLGGVFIIGLLNVYYPFIQLIDKTMVSLCVSLQKDASNQNLKSFHRFQTEFEMKKEQAIDGKDVETNTWAKIKGFYQAYKPDKIATSILHQLLHVTSMVVGIAMWLIAWLFIKLLHVIGPLAIVFSIIPMFKNQMAKWLNGLLGLYSTLLVIVLLDVILNGFTSIINHTIGSVGEIDPTVILLMDVVIIAVYLSAFKYASYIVGDDAGSTVVSNIMRVANTSSNIFTSLTKGKMGGQNSAAPNNMSGIK